MSAFDRLIAKQLANPAGVGGQLVCAVMNRQNRPLYEATLDLLPPCPGKVLDVGCGNGFVMAMLAATHKGGLVGIDPAKGVIAEAKRRHRRMISQALMAFDVGSAEAIGQPSDTFDLAYSINTVYFWPDAEAGFAEVGRVLKPGGLFFNSLYTATTLGRFSHTAHGYRKYEPAELVAAARQAGLTAESIPLFKGGAFCVKAAKPI
ncbi:MAG: class I SAM-dependent methyltransferase [Bifidobacteriaceae bacterium]|jgi:ubiquinone/menaquinone biosynthesis C-methylase UbiE|nr:class I SAM-dependent methyltransferase [Bifidobacteriaceae bacterium]